MNAAPRLESCYFSAVPDRRWDRMAAVLRYTAAQQCPGWRVNVHALAPAGHRGHSRTVANNTHKLDEWARIVAAAADGDRIALVDADVFLLRPLDDVWAWPFDVAITTKPGAEYPINGGVVFLRVSPASRRFMADWQRANAEMLADPGFHLPWRRRFAGINQAALGYLRDGRGLPDLQLRELPCAEWNCEDAHWASFDPAVTRIVHVKSALRLACLETQPIPPELLPLVRVWKDLEARARAQMSRTA